MQSSSRELSAVLADCVYIDNYLPKNSFAYAKNEDSSEIRYPTDLKSRSQLEVSRVSSHTEELWYNKTVC